MNSYASAPLGFIDRVREAVNLAFVHSREVELRAALVIERTAAMRGIIERALGEPLKGKKILDLGPGQQLRYMSCLAIDNDMLGVDLDVIAQGFEPRSYLRMLYSNGATRTAKTIARKLLGVDRRFNRELARQLRIPRIPSWPVLHMDAARVTLPDSSFDCIISRSVFHHLPDPVAVMKQIARMLRPGGVAYVSVHLYTSVDGACDPRVFAGVWRLPRWAHLRPAHAALVRSNSFLNKLRLSEWEAYFHQCWPGVQYHALSLRRARPAGGAC